MRLPDHIASSHALTVTLLAVLLVLTAFTSAYDPCGLASAVTVRDWNGRRDVTEADRALFGQLDRITLWHDGAWHIPPAARQVDGYVVTLADGGKRYVGLLRTPDGTRLAIALAGLKLGADFHHHDICAATEVTR